MVQFFMAWDVQNCMVQSSMAWDVQELYGAVVYGVGCGELYGAVVYGVGCGDASDHTYARVTLKITSSNLHGGLINHLKQGTHRRLVNTILASEYNVGV